ncbi:MAG: alpha/beta hydrolase [Gemmatimonadetes bacterium]|nr:alpha/beta hydrolase [Gemmatimonadota bacterium]
MTPLIWGAAGVAAAGGLYTLDRVAIAVVRPVPGDPDVTVPELGISYEDLDIPSGDHVLKGWLLHGEREGRSDANDPLVLLTHGWGASYGTVLQLALPLVKAGYDVLVFDIRGHGRNAAVPFATVRHFRDDVEAVVRYARDRFPARQLVAGGHSLGAAAVVLAAARGAPVAGLVLVASPADVLEVTADYLRSRGFPGRFMVVALRPFWWMRIRGSFRGLVPSTAIARVRRPVLIVQAGRDRRVPAEHAGRLARASGRPVHVVPGAGHTEVLGSPETHRLVLEFLKTMADEPGAR